MPNKINFNNSSFMSAPTLGNLLDGTVKKIKEYRVYYTIDEQTPGEGVPIVISGTSSSETVTLELLPRAKPYVIGFAISTVDTAGRESVRSETVSKTFDVDSTAKPNAPTNLQFTLSCGDGCTITEVGIN